VDRIAPVDRRGSVLHYLSSIGGMAPFTHRRNAPVEGALCSYANQWRYSLSGVCCDVRRLTYLLVSRLCEPSG
jgi:hypothetical protein